MYLLLSLILSILYSQMIEINETGWRLGHFSSMVLPKTGPTCCLWVSQWAKCCPGFEADVSTCKDSILTVTLPTGKRMEWKLVELVITHLREPQPLEALWGGGLGILGSKGPKSTRSQGSDLSLQPHPTYFIQTSKILRQGTSSSEWRGQQIHSPQNKSKTEQLLKQSFQGSG